MADVIYRQAAIDALHIWEMFYHWDETCLEDRERAYAPSEVIEDLPEVEPERRKGHWIVRNEYSMWPILCSECRGWQSGRSRFCPECGADMRGE